jgi:hypothetical protein
MCCKAEEHIKHIVAGCTALAPSGYTNRHNKVAGYIQWKICKHMGLQVTENSHEYVSERVINVKSTTFMWDVLVVKDGTVLSKLPHIVIQDDKGKTFLLIDIALPDDSNLNTKENEKLRKYKDLWRSKSKDVENWDKNSASCNWIIGNN